MNSEASPFDPISKPTLEVAALDMTIFLRAVNSATTLLLPCVNLQHRNMPFTQIRNSNQLRDGGQESPLYFSVLLCIRVPDWGTDEQTRLAD
jgi:hypothetical protein